MFVVILIIVIVASAGLLIAFGGLLNPSSTTNGDPKYNYSFSIAPDGHQWVSWELATSLGIYGNFSVTPTSSKIDLFICNAENYQSFESTGVADKEYETYTNVGSFKFVIPSDDIWYWVLFNNGSESISVQLTLAQDASAPKINHNLEPSGEYAGVVLVTATISDTFDIPLVEFRVDNALVESQSGKNFQYSWDTTLWANGIHHVSFIAQDNVGNKRNTTMQIELIN